MQEYKGKTLDEVLNTIASEKGCEVADTIYTVLEEKKGILGIGSYVLVEAYTKEDIKETVLKLTNGKGADIIMDQSIGDGLIPELDYLADMGTVLMYNNTKGSPSGDLIGEMVKRFGRCPAIRAFSFHFFDDKPELLKQKKQEMFSLLQQGKIKPHVGATFALDDVQKAHELLDSGNFFGSIVLNCE